MLVLSWCFLQCRDVNNVKHVYTVYKSARGTGDFVQYKYDRVTISAGISHFDARVESDVPSWRVYLKIFDISRVKYVRIHVAAYLKRRAALRVRIVSIYTRNGIISVVLNIHFARALVPKTMGTNCAIFGSSCDKE